jgi:hypothetical protein
VTTRRHLNRAIGACACSALIACQPENVVCADVGGASGLRLEVRDRRSQMDLTPRTTITLRNLRTGTSLTGIGNEPFRITGGAEASWSILAEVPGFRSKQDTVLIRRIEGCERDFTPPTHRMELDPDG